MLLRIIQGFALASVLAVCGPACATMLPVDTVLVTAPQYVGKFDLALDPGQYQITATDLDYLNEPLKTLKFGVFTATKAIATMNGAGTLQFFNPGSEKISLQIYAEPAAGFSAGLVNFKTQAVVALPASIVLLGSTLVGWLMLGGRRGRPAASVVPASAPTEPLPRWSDLARRLVWVLAVMAFAPRSRRRGALAARGRRSARDPGFDIPPAGATVTTV
jgi:hypothetical protein